MPHVFTHSINQPIPPPTEAAGTAGLSRRRWGASPPTFVWLAGLFFLLLGGAAPKALGQTSGIFEGYVILNTNGAGNVFWDMNPATTTANPDFNGGNLGLFGTGNTLVLNGAQLKTFKNSGDNISSTRLQYRIYPYTATPGAFIPLNLPFSANIGGPCAPDPCDQRWEQAAAGINVLNTLTPGIYILEVFGEATATSGTKFYSNNTNFRAQFTVGSSLINESFEAGIGSFTAVNGAITNKWQTGTAAGATAGTNAAYVSNTAISPFLHNYANTTSTTHIYRDVTIPSGETLINLSFSWRNNGENNFDYLRVSTAPTTFTPSAI
jgi:hypothetical protein